MMDKVMDKNSETVLKSRYLMESETCWNDVVDRLIGEMKKIDTDSRFLTNCHDSIKDMDFIPGGRILRNLGRLKGSCMNCNVVELADSIESIGEALKSSLIIWSHGGGVGLNFSALRPIRDKISTKGGESSGLISFLKAMDGVASTIETGGQRRSASIALCSIYHPESESFIDLKLNDGFLSYFNLSVIIDSDFLKAVEKEDKWDYKFSGRDYGSVDAAGLWEKILNNMINSAEPGLINWTNLIKNNTYYFSPIVAVNPCGEQPLPAWGCCDIGAINLVNFLDHNSNTQWEKLKICIETSVRFLDNVIDLNYYPIDKLEVEAKNSRRIGLGVMGLADYLIRKKLRYGSKESLHCIEDLFKFIRDRAYEASVNLAVLKKPFPQFDRIHYGHSSFIKKLPASLRLSIKETGIRNSNLLTCAPTGTTSLLPNVSSGIEPIIFKSYKRHDRVGDRIYVHPLCKSIEDIRSDHFVDTTDLSPKDHLEVQATIQKYIDSGISKTINVPKDIDIGKLSNLLLEYINDLKGVTVYRDGSREGQIYEKLSEEELAEALENQEKEEDLCISDIPCGDGSCSR